MFEFLMEEMDLLGRINLHSTWQNTQKKYNILAMQRECYITVKNMSK